jgi:hypothetical protein
MIRSLFIITLCIGQLGIPFVQVVAWVGMISSYSLTESSFEKAISLTFDGEHPCDLCQAVTKLSTDSSTKSTPGQQAKRIYIQPWLSLLPTPYQWDVKYQDEALSVLHPSVNEELFCQYYIEVDTPPPTA